MPSVSSVGKVVKYGPHPSLDVIKNWKSIVELILRAVAAVLSLILLIACAVAQADPSGENVDDNLLGRSNAAAGWGAFLAFVCLVTEAVFIIMRFLNCGFITHYLTISIIVDICVSAAFAVLLFISGIPLAVFASQWADEVNSAESDGDSDLKDKIDGISPSLQAASALCFIAMIGFIALLVWIVLHLVLGWCKPSHQTES